MFLRQLTWCQRWSGTAPRPALHRRCHALSFFSPSVHQLHNTNTLNNEASTWRYVVLVIFVFFFFRAHHVLPCPLYWEITRKTFASHRLSHLLIYHVAPIRLTVYVNVLSALLGPIHHPPLCACQWGIKAMGTQRFYRSRSYLLLVTAQKLSFNNKQILMRLWPQNLKVRQPPPPPLVSLAVEPKPARGCSSVLVTEMASLVTVQMTGALVKDISPPVKSQVSSQIGCWPPERLRSGGRRVGRRGSWR